MTDLPVTFAERDGEQLLACPVCGGTHTHGLSARAIVTNEAERRVDLALAFKCEEAHGFEVVFKQHKGSTCARAVTRLRMK